MSIDDIGIFNEMVSVFKIRYSFAGVNEYDLFDCANHAIVSHHSSQTHFGGIANSVENLLDIG